MSAALGDVFRVVAKMKNGLDDVQNVYHVKLLGTTAPDDEDLYDAVATVLDNAYDSIDGPMDDTMTFSTISMYNLTQDYFVGEEAWPTMTQGSGTGGELPPQLAPLVLFPTDVLKSVGRKFLPSLAEEALDTDGTLTSGVLAALAAYATTLLTGVVAGDYTVEWGNYRSIGEIFIPWVSAIVRDWFATQRRRYIGSGS